MRSPNAATPAHALLPGWVQVSLPLLEMPGGLPLGVSLIGPRGSGELHLDLPPRLA